VTWHEANNLQVLRAKEVSFRYPQEGHGLKPISLEINPGEFTLVTGPSGCGKSTLARCLMGLIPHLYHGELTGEVWLDGHRTSDAPMWQLAEKAGMVFQNPAAQMLAPSIEEEIIFGLENLGLQSTEINSRLEMVLDEFNLSHMRERNPQTLSGGEQQRLALAAIMARQPDALILDEPLSMLDTTAAEELIAYLESFVAEGKTLVMFEHRQEYLEGLKGIRHLALDGKMKQERALPENMLPQKGTDFRLEIENLSVHLSGMNVLDDLNLSLESGQIVAVVGRNGVGKTTLLRALSGLQKYTGTAKAITTHGEQRPDLGMVFQNPDLQLFNASVRDEILYRLPDPDMDYYHWLISALGLGNYESTPPLLLSEGEKKRLALGLVLMRYPTHGVLLDEPSLGQDHAHKTILIRILRALADAGQLVIITTHDLTLAEQADRLILLGQDGIIADDDTEAVIANSAAWERTGLTLPPWFLRERERESAR
jgi:energy-coupling factor transport system ATP-binding protein